MARAAHGSQMDILQATQKYETWLANHLTILKDDLAAKHLAMAVDPFSFMRATFYRWAQIFPERCKRIASTPEVFSDRRSSR